MKKKFSIVISLAFLWFALISCEQEDQISYINSVEQSVTIDKNATLPLQTGTVTKEKIENESCGDPLEVNLMAGQHSNVGTISITNSETKLFVTYDLSGTDWWITETHLFAGNINDAPFTNSGNPQIGKFPFHGPKEVTQNYTYVVSIEDLNNPISIIAHAVVVQKRDGQIIASETAFGKGDTEFSGNRWGWIIDYEFQNCDDHESVEEETNQDNIIENDPIDNDKDYEIGCMDAFAYSNSQNSTCLFPDFERWGWTNLLEANDQHYVPGGVTYTFPLYASAFDCAIDNSILIGEVKISVSGGDNNLYGSITVHLTKQELSLTEIHIYVGDTAYPIDALGNSTIEFEEFDVSLNNLNEKTYTINWIDWFEETNFIVHVKVCPEEILN